MTFKRLQIAFTEEAWKAVEAVTTEANTNFPGGTINVSDAINEMLLNAKVDIKALQLKHTDYRRLIKKAAKDRMELDTVIKLLQEVKAGGASKRSARGSQKEGGDHE